MKQSENDKKLVAGIQNDPWAVGFFGYAYYQQNQDILHTLPVEGINPLPETVDQAAYPLARPLFIYTTVETLQQKPHVAQFINFYLGRVKDYIIDVGYFLPTENALEEAIQTFNTPRPDDNSGESNPIPKPKAHPVPCLGRPQGQFCCRPARCANRCWPRSGRCRRGKARASAR